MYAPVHPVCEYVPPEIYLKFLRMTPAELSSYDDALCCALRNMNNTSQSYVSIASWITSCFKTKLGAKQPYIDTIHSFYEQGHLNSFLVLIVIEFELVNPNRLSDTLYNMIRSFPFNDKTVPLLTALDDEMLQRLVRIIFRVWRFHNQITSSQIANALCVSNSRICRFCAGSSSRYVVEAFCKYYARLELLFKK